MVEIPNIKSDKLRALIYYTAIIILLYAPVVLTGKSLQPPLYQPHGVMEGFPYEYEGRTPVNSFNVDLATPSYYEWPVNSLVGDIYASAALPLWNPYQGAGTPLAADYSTRAFFPYQILEDLSPVWTWDFFLLGRLLIAGFFSFLFLSLLGLSFQSAFIGGLFFAFSGTFVWFINLEQMANVSMMIPVLLYSTERLIQKVAKGSIPIVAVSVAMVITGGQPEIALYVLFLASSYAIFRIIGRRKERDPIKTTIFLVAALAIGLALSAPLILPFMEFMDLGYTMHKKGIGIGTQYISNLKMIFNVLVPGASVIPTHPDLIPEALASFTGAGGEKEYFRIFATKGLWDSVGGFTGILAPFIAITALLTMLASKGRDKHPHLSPLIFFLAFGLSILLKNFGIWPFVLLGKLPMFELVWGPRWSAPTWVFSITMAGAFGLETLKRLYESSANGEQKTRYKPGIIVPVILLALSAAYIIIQLPGVFLLSANAAKHFSPEIAPYITPSILASNIVMIVVLFCAFILAFTGRASSGKALAYGFIALAIAELWWSVPRGYDFQTLSQKPLVFALMLPATFLFYRGRFKWGTAFIALFLISFLILDWSAARGLPIRSDPFNRPPHVEFLKAQEGHYRIMGTEGAWYPNYASTAALHDIRHINAMIIPNFREYRKKYLEIRLPNEAKNENFLWFTGRPERVVVAYNPDIGNHYRVEKSDVFTNIKERSHYYSLLSVKYIIAPKGRGVTALNMPIIYDKEVVIYENRSALPRAFVSYGFKLYSGADEARLMGSDKLVALVTDPPAGFTSKEEDRSEAALIKEEGPNKVIVEARLKRPGILVLTDTFYPGWKASVDGVDKDIYLANGIVRGVFLDEGTHTIVFRYMPASFKRGLTLFAAAFFISILLLLPLKRRSQASQERHKK